MNKDKDKEISFKRSSTPTLIQMTMRSHPSIPISAFRALRRIHSHAGELLEVLVASLTNQHLASRERVEAFAGKVDELMAVATNGFVDEDIAALRMITR